MASPTLNIIKDEILAFARDHGQINTGRFCPASRLLEDGDIAYPCLYFDFTGGRKERAELVMSFSVWVADRVNPEADNEADVWSDTVLIMCDLLGYLDADARDYKLQEGAGLKPFREEQGDNIAGITTDFTLRITFPFDRCIIPAKP